MAADAFVELCLELLAPLGAVRVRRMFGGHGLYVDGLFVAIVADEGLFLKTDAATREDFGAAGCTPFVFEAAGRSLTMSYWSVPPEALESPALMAPWGRRALAAALRATAARAAKVPTNKAARRAPAPPATPAARKRAPRGPR